VASRDWRNISLMLCVTFMYGELGGGVCRLGNRTVNAQGSACRDVGGPDGGLGGQVLARVPFMRQN